MQNVNERVELKLIFHKLILLKNIVLPFSHFLPLIEFKVTSDILANKVGSLCKTENLKKLIRLFH